jgi:multiple sugar transport system permease protein
MSAAVADWAPPRVAPGSSARPYTGRWFTAVCVGVLVVFAALWLIPLLWAADTSLRPEASVTAHPASWWDGHFTLDAYRSVIASTDLTDWYVNSAITSALTALLTVVVCSLAGFALARLWLPGRRVLNGLLLCGIVVPHQVLILPLFSEFSAAHLLNSYWALILPAAPAPVAVFVFAAFFSGLPPELVDAAQVDGAGWFTVYRRIFLPLSKPAISAVAIFTFVWSWNSLLWPLLVMTSTKLMTIPVGLAVVQSNEGPQYAKIMASAVLGALPLLAAFLVFQRRIVEGIAQTGIR